MPAPLPRDVLAQAPSLLAVRRLDAHHDALVSAFLRQTTPSYRAWTWIKFALRLALIFGPHAIAGVPPGVASLLSAAACIWVVVDAFRMPFARAAHRARLSLGVQGAVAKFLHQRMKAHAPLEGQRLHDALVADLRGSPETQP